MGQQTSLKKLAHSNHEEASNGVIELLIADHNLMRKLMKKIQSQKSSDEEIIETFHELIKTVASHVEAEEYSLFELIKDNLKFKDDVLEGYEEHRVHENVIDGIKKIKNKERKIQQMKIFCEILEHHLDEEESDLFPKFTDYTAPTTRKKIGHNFLEIRKDSFEIKNKKGALGYI